MTGLTKIFYALRYGEQPVGKKQVMALVNRVDRVEQALAAVAGVPDSVRKVAVMRHPAPETWDAVRDGFAPDVLQTDAEDFAGLDVPATIERWPVYREGNRVTDTFGVGQKVPGTFLYEGARSGQGQTVDWTRAADVARRGNMILAGGLRAANLAEAIATVRPFGVDVSSAVESAPGVKDPVLIEEFVKAARAAEREL